MATLEEDVHEPDFGEIVELYTLDLASINGETYRFTSGTKSGMNIITFRGEAYMPVDVMAEGFEVSGRGTLPTPTFRVSNTTRALTSLVNSLDDLIGAKVTRLRVLAKYLDGQPEADPSGAFKPDVYVVEQKSAQNKLFIEFRLAAAIDVEGQKIPRRQVIRNYCSHVYRYWDAQYGWFDNSHASCPYAGSASFDVKGVATSADKDRCGKRLSDCQKRFGIKSALPYWGFPGAGRF